MAHLKYNPNMSGGTEENHKESVKTASDQAENGVSDFQIHSAMKLCTCLDVLRETTKNLSRQPVTRQRMEFQTSKIHSAMKLCTCPLLVNPSVMLGFIFLLLPKMEEF